MRFDAITAQDLQGSRAVNWPPGTDIIGGRVAEMSLGQAPPVTEALHRAVDQGMVGYAAASLSEEMADAVASWYRDTTGWAVDPQNVHPVTDVITTLRIAISHFADPQGAVIVPTPTYMKFLTVPRALGRRVIQVPMRTDRDRMEFDLDGLDRAFQQGGSLLLLCNPFNPLGRVFTREELLAVSEVVHAHGGRVFSDEVHSPVVLPGAVHVPYASLSPITAAHTVTGTSAAKAWNLAGVKCAQLILSNDADTRIWEKVKGLDGQGASTLGMVANTAAFSLGRPWLQEVVTYLDQSRHLLGDLLAAHLPEVGYRPPEGTFVAWFDLKGLGAADPVALLNRPGGVALTDGLACGDAGAGCARFSYAMPHPLLREAVERMATILKQAGPA